MSFVERFQIPLTQHLELVKGAVTCATYSQEPHDNALAAISGNCRQRTTDKLLEEIADLRRKRAP